MALNDVKEITIPTPDNIPGYKRVEYVQSTNNDCSVDLGFIPTSATKIDFDFMITKCNNTAWNPFFGARGATNTTYFCGFINGTSNKFSPNYAGFDPGANSNVTISLNVKHNIKNNAGTFYFDNSSNSSISTTNTLVTGTQNFSLFCTSNTSGYYTRNIEMRVYGLKVYEGSSLIRNLIPVKSSSDVYGLYDLVNSVFYTPVQANPLIGGDELTTYSVSKIEDSNGNIIWGSQSAFPYRRLEYIHFSGAEYINTNKSMTGPSTYKRIESKIRFQDINRWSYCGYIGNNNNLCFGTRPTNLATFSLGAANYGTTAYALSTNTIYQYDLWVNASNSNNLTILDENGSNLWRSNSLTASWSGNTGNLYIGACYDARNSGPSGYMVSDIFSFTIRQPNYNTILFNGIPCQRKSDGVCGMYDTISGTFKPMVGTTITDTAAGPIVNEYWDLQA